MSSNIIFFILFFIFFSIFFYFKVPQSHLWGNSNPNLHASFTLRPTVPGVRQLAMQVR